MRELGLKKREWLTEVGKAVKHAATHRTPHPQQSHSVNGVKLGNTGEVKSEEQELVLDLE